MGTDCRQPMRFKFADEYRAHRNSRCTPESKLVLLGLYVITGDPRYYYKSTTNHSYSILNKTQMPDGFSHDVYSVDAQEDRLAWMDKRMRFMPSEYAKENNCSATALCKDLEVEEYCGIRFYKQKNGGYSRLQDDAEMTEDMAKKSNEEYLRAYHEGVKSRKAISIRYARRLRRCLKYGCSEADMALKLQMDRKLMMKKIQGYQPFTARQLDNIRQYLEKNENDRN